MMQDLPIVLITSANDSDAPLDMLEKESRSLLRTLRAEETAARIRIYREESTRLDELYEDILYFDQRIVIFHYAGHAERNRLMFEGGAARGPGLAELLGRQSQLKLVFLNGCATEEQVAGLIKAGVPAVIATTDEIDDEIAFEFADGFYLALAAGKSVPDAYFLAKAYIISSDGVFRDLIDDTDALHSIENTEIPWTLHLNAARPEREITWSLADGFTPVGEPVLDLDHNPMQTPEGETVHLVDPALSLPNSTLRCRECSTHSVLTLEGGFDARCPICQSSDVERVEQTNLVGHGMQPFTISREDARNKLHAYLSQSSGVSRDFERSLGEPVPFLAPAYLMTCSTKTEYDVELGTIVQESESDWSYQWNASNSFTNTEIDDLLVNAGSLPDSLIGELRTGRWSEDRKMGRPTTKQEQGVVTGQYTRGVQSAVDVLNNRYRTGVINSIIDGFEADDYRELQVDIRYEKLSYRQVLLPLWLFCSHSRGSVWLFSVCGLTGETRGELPPARWKFWKRFG